ncbi:hypothetical protein EYZ11_000764 [Aspergillus tanneri]|nr:hypothetical protein EYZ11_000764 [Aspergillus tanneri]
MEMSGEPWYKSAALVLGSAIPMVFVAYTGAPFVNFVHLALPVFARQSREKTIQYAKNLPPTATLYINTMKISTGSFQTSVRLGDLAYATDRFRPVTFQITKEPLPGRLTWLTPRKFFAEPHSSPGHPAPAFYPQLWEPVYKQIQSRRLPVKK